MMRKLPIRLVYVLVYLIVACNNQPNKIIAANLDSNITSNPKTSTVLITNDTLSSENLYDTFFVAIVDTGYNYYMLRDAMLTQSIASNLAIDTLERTFDAKKQKIVLPEDYGDDLYAGDYYPRRFPSNTLSIEPLTMYDSTATATTFAIIAGIFSTKNSADSLLLLHRKIFPKAYVVKSPMFVGCLH